MLSNGKLTEKKLKIILMFFYWCRTIGIIYVSIKKEYFDVNGTT